MLKNKQKLEQLNYLSLKNRNLDFFSKTKKKFGGYRKLFYFSSTKKSGQIENSFHLD